MGRPARRQVDVALPRDVERVPLAAPQGAIARLERARADGAAEQIDGRAEHPGILAAMKVIRNDELPTRGSSPEFVGDDRSMRRLTLATGAASRVIAGGASMVPVGATVSMTTVDSVLPRLPARSAMLPKATRSAYSASA